MRILTRYLLRAHVAPFLFALIALTSILLVNTVARQLENLAGKGLPASAFVEVFGLSVPHVVALTLPMAVLVAVLYTFSQLTAENEITAMKASGVNLLRLLVPVLGAGVLLAVFMVWFNDQVLPNANHRLANLLLDIARKTPTLQLKEQVINEIDSGDMRSRYYLQAANIDAGTNRLKDVVIYDLSDPAKARTVYADSGRMAFNRERTDLFLELRSGWVHDLSTRQPDQFQRTRFDSYLLDLKDVGNQFEHSGDSYRGDREMGLAELRAEAESARKELARVGQDAAARSGRAVTLALQGVERRPPPPVYATPPAQPEHPRYRPEDEMVRQTALELRVLRDRQSALQDRLNSYEVEYHKKFAIPFACIVFVLIGAPLAVRFPRGGMGMVIAISLSIFGIYYVGLIGGETLSDNGLLAPFWAMWAANILFLAASVWGLVRIGHEASTTRGGGWDDLLHTLRGAALHPVRVLLGRGRAA